MKALLALLLSAGLALAADTPINNPVLSPHVTGKGPTATIAPGTHIGTGATATIVGNDIAGNLTVVTNIVGDSTFLLSGGGSASYAFFNSDNADTSGLDGHISGGAGPICTVTFAHAYDVAPVVKIFPTSYACCPWMENLYVTPSTTGFQINYTRGVGGPCIASGSPAMTFKFSYEVLQVRISP